ncbi:MAG: hypothetical protein IKS05_09985 [Oscillospiraceae bacterium]|nr:hypothetical protein [Oscillospiraceae bacterium]
MPSKNTAGFPGMAERRSLIEKLKNLGGNGNYFLPYLEALKNLDSLLDQYSRGNAFGLAPALTEADRKKLTEALLAAANAGEAFLADAENRNALQEEGPQLAERMQTLLSTDYAALNAYDPAQSLSFPELQEEARTLTVDFRGKKLKVKSGLSAARIPMTVVDADGTKRQGFFSKARSVNIVSSYQEAIEKAKAFCNDNGKKALDRVLGKIKASLSSLRGYEEDSQRDDLALSVAAQFAKPAKAHGWSRQLLQDYKVNTKNIPDKAIAVLDDFFASMKKSSSNQLGLNDLKLKEGVRLDNRNSAMTAVADLMGLPQLLARSTPMRFLDEEGREVEGTFMEQAKGVDLQGPGTDNRKPYAQVADEPFDNSNNPLIKQLADMQVLDYLCGNVDRHAANMVYQLDENGRIIGVQGIDNDSSFGRFTDQKKSVNRMYGLDQMNVMSAGMAEKIKLINPDMLRLSLRGYVLEKEDLDAACVRLAEVKQRIRGAKQLGDIQTGFPELEKGRLNIISDATIGKLNIKYAKEKCGESLISMVTDTLQADLREARRNGFDRNYYQRHPQEFAPKAAAQEVSTTARKYTAGGMADALGEAARLIKNEATGFEISSYTGYWRRSSGAFRDMVRAANNAAKVQKRLAAAFNNDQDRQKLFRDNQTVQAEKLLSDEAMERLEQQTNHYLQRKMNQRGAADAEDLLRKASGEYERKRIRYALKVQAAVQNYKQLDKLSTEAQKTERAAAESRIQSREQRKQAPQEGVEIQNH